AFGHEEAAIMQGIARSRNPVDLEEPLALLRDCRAAFGQEDAIHTVTLIDRLERMEDAPWGMLFERVTGNAKTDRPVEMWLRDRLAQFQVMPEKEAITIGKGRARGYLRKAFVRAWDKFLGELARPSTTNTRPEKPEVV